MPDALPFEPAGFEPVQRKDASALSIVPRLENGLRPEEAVAPVESKAAHDRVAQIARDIVEIHRACATLALDEPAAPAPTVRRREASRTAEWLPIVIGGIIGVLVMFASTIAALVVSLTR
ncbi:MAG: hypothetical protein AB7K64_04610 [Variibacter sp.]